MPSHFVGTTSQVAWRSEPTEIPSPHSHLGMCRWKGPLPGPFPTWRKVSVYFHEIQMTEASKVITPYFWFWEKPLGIDFPGWGSQDCSPCLWTWTCRCLGLTACIPPPSLHCIDYKLLRVGTRCSNFLMFPLSPTRAYWMHLETPTEGVSFFFKNYYDYFTFYWFHFLKRRDCISLFKMGRGRDHLF